MTRLDNRFVAELPTGLIKNPQMPIAGDDFAVNDVVYIDNGVVYPMFSEEKEVYGVVAAAGIKGKPVLVAA